MPVAFSIRVRPSPDVLVTQVQGQAVLLDLKTEKYFGLEDVGTRMWELLTVSSTVEAAYDALLKEYAVDPTTLKGDLETLVDKLLGLGLLQVVAA